MFSISTLVTILVILVLIYIAYSIFTKVTKTLLKIAIVIVLILIIFFGYQYIESPFQQIPNLFPTDNGTIEVINITEENNNFTMESLPENTTQDLNNTVPSLE